ncbi:MAG: glucose-6-phosphate isomerase family protein [Peptococcaceae bacterium]
MVAVRPEFTKNSILNEYDLTIPAVRYLDALQGLTCTDFVCKADKPIYYMYRGAKKKDAVSALTNGIRYDITVIPPYRLNGEFVKTVGHFHPLREQGNDTYPEYYEVLEGEALYLLQKNTAAGDVDEVIFIEAQAGEKVYIPPNYGHITINKGQEMLVMCNLVEAIFKSDYAPIQEKGGAAYFCLDDGQGSFKLVPNKKYNREVTPRIIKADDWPAPIDTGQDTLYDLYLRNPHLFSFLK